MRAIRTVVGASLLTVAGAVHAIPVTLSQTVLFPEIQAREFHVGTEASFLFPQWSSIDLIVLTFATIDRDFNLGIGPTGGDSGVEIAVLTEGTEPTRFGIASVVPGNQVVTLYPNSGDPLGRFDLVSSLLLDGSLTVSLGSFENFPGCCSFGFALDQLSFLNLQVAGDVASVPEPGTLVLMGLGLVGLGLARRKRARPASRGYRRAIAVIRKLDGGDAQRREL